MTTHGRLSSVSLLRVQGNLGIGSAPGQVRPDHMGHKEVFKSGGALVEDVGWLSCVAGSSTDRRPSRCSIRPTTIPWLPRWPPASTCQCQDNGEPESCQWKVRWTFTTRPAASDRTPRPRFGSSPKRGLLNSWSRQPAGLDRPVHAFCGADPTTRPARATLPRCALVPSPERAAGLPPGADRTDHRIGPEQQSLNSAERSRRGCS